MPVCERWEPIDGETESGNERFIPYPTLCTGDEQVVPQPPAGWFFLFRYASDTTSMEPSQLTDLAVWLSSVAHAQKWSKSAGTRLHLICREPNGNRFVAVHPVCKPALDNWNETIQGYIEDGYEDRIERDSQLLAARAHVRKHFSTLPVSRLVTFLHIMNIPARAIMDPKLGWIEQINHAGDLLDLVDGDID